jgi:hypothetical protein
MSSALIIRAHQASIKRLNKAIPFIQHSVAAIAACGSNIDNRTIGVADEESPCHALSCGIADKRTGTPFRIDCPTTASTSPSSVQSLTDTPGR